MPPALELVAGSYTAPGSTFSALAAYSGSTFTVRNATMGSNIQLLQMWAKVQAAGAFRLRSPLLHDNVHGIHFTVPSGDVTPLMDFEAYQPLKPQDILLAEITGSSTGGQIEIGSLLIYYADLPGASARLTDEATVKAKTKNVLTVQVPITPGSSGGFGGSAAINSYEDLLKANTDYAIMGIETDVLCAAITVKGPDTSNLRVGSPGQLSPRFITREWFAVLADWYGLPLIPVFNSANKGGTIVEVAQDQADSPSTVNVVLNLREIGAL